MQSKLKNIHSKPTSIDKIHESCYRSYSILEYVLEMIQRGDSKETIAEVVEYLKEKAIDVERKK